jgi:hypothetical protein
MCVAKTFRRSTSWQCCIWTHRHVDALHMTIILRDVCNMVCVCQRLSDGPPVGNGVYGCTDVLMPCIRQLFRAAPCNELQVKGNIWQNVDVQDSLHNKASQYQVTKAARAPSPFSRAVRCAASRLTDALCSGVRAAAGRRPNTCLPKYLV